MSLPKGQAPKAKGVKGRSGRKSAYAEKADAEFLAQLFFKEHTKEEIEAMLEKKRSVSKVMLSKALAGNERHIANIFNKLFPDRLINDLQSGGKPFKVTINRVIKQRED